MNQEIWNRTEWFRKERFGMFIHWGLYAIPALGEWVMSEKRMTVEEYEKYFEQFDPTDYNPREWARLAKKAGMKYAVLTAKHHDGFCLFDSALTDYKATNTKAGRDLVREFLDAFRAEGLKVGLYFTLIDWHHPDYPKYNYIPASCRSFSFCLLIITHCCDSVAPFSKIKLRKPSEFFLTIISGVLLLKIERPYVIS